MSSPGWTDDELLNGLRAALREAPVDESVIRAGQAAFTWRTVDADLEVLGLDADADAELAVMTLVRGSGPASLRLLTFHGEGLSVAVEIDEAGIVGQLTPPGPGSVTLVTADGPHATTQADEAGGFALPPPPSGPVRLECALGAGHFITEWTTL